MVILEINCLINKFMIPEKQNIVQFKSLVKSLIYLFMTIIFLVMGLFLLVFFNSSITAWFQNSGPDLDSLYVEAEKKVILQNEMERHCGKHH